MPRTYIKLNAWIVQARVLITVKTYPAISKKYEELVCTAGFLEDGTWIRIYPIQFRKKAYSEQYSKYEWIELDLVKNDSDFRPESYRPFSHDTPIEKVGEIKQMVILGKKDGKLY